MSQPLEVLIDSLSSEDPRVAASAAESLAQSSASIQSAAVPLSIAAGSEDESLCEWASAALESLGSPNESDLDALSDLVKLYLEAKAHPATAYWALTLMSRLGPTAATELGTIIQAAEFTGDASVKEKAVLCLGTIGSMAQAALPILNRLAADDSPRLSRLARMSIDQVKS